MTKSTSWTMITVIKRQMIRTEKPMKNRNLLRYNMARKRCRLRVAAVWRCKASKSNKVNHCWTVMKLISMIQIRKSIEIAREKNHSLTNSIKKQISVIIFEFYVLTSNQIIFSISLSFFRLLPIQGRHCSLAGRMKGLDVDFKIHSMWDKHLRSHHPTRTYGSHFNRPRLARACQQANRRHE